MSERRKVWTVIQTRAPGEKAAQIGGATVVLSTGVQREADDAYWHIRTEGGAGYVAQREER